MFSNNQQTQAQEAPQTSKNSSSGSKKSEADSSSSNSNNNNNKDDNSQYECNICLDTAKDAVISMCGHLFCWPCLFQWLETRPNNQTCPVCKSTISKEKVIPLYGRNCTDKKDPRDKVPPRPQGQRTEAPRNSSFTGFGFEGFQLSFGIGAFPFSLFATTFNLGDSRSVPPAAGNPQYYEEQFLQYVFLAIAVIFIFMMLFA